MPVSIRQKWFLTDSTDLARSDIGASAKAVQSLQAKIKQNMTAALDTKLDKSALSDDIDSESSETAASSAAINVLRKKVPNLAMPSEKYIDLGDLNQSNVASADGYLMMGGTVNPTSSAQIVGAAVRDPDDHSLNDITNGYSASVWGISWQDISVTIPVKKGRKYDIYHGDIRNIQARFYYAEGAIEE